MSEVDREKWDAKYGDAALTPREPSAVLMGLAEYLQRRGRALDVAGGGGRNAIWLARRGLAVTIADVSRVGLALASERAAAAGLTITTRLIDLEEEPLEVDPFDLIVSVCYLWRPKLIAQIPQLLAAGGTLAMIQPTKRNLERHEKPPAAYLLEEGELRRMVDGLDVVYFEEGWLADGRHDAAVVARKA